MCVHLCVWVHECMSVVNSTLLLCSRCSRSWVFSTSRRFRSCTGSLTPSSRHCCTFCCRLSDMTHIVNSPIPVNAHKLWPCELQMSQFLDLMTYSTLLCMQEWLWFVCLLSFVWLHKYKCNMNVFWCWLMCCNLIWIKELIQTLISSK